MRDIWFVDSPDARAFHLFDDCPALDQAVQEVFSERIPGLARIVQTDWYDLYPCERCRQRVDAEEGNTEWEDRLEATARRAGPAISALLGGERPTAAMLRGVKPLRILERSNSALDIYTDRFEITRPGLWGEGETWVMPFADIYELRKVTWVPMLRKQGIEIDFEVDGERFTNRFDLDLSDSPDTLLDQLDGLILESNEGAATAGAERSRKAEPKAQPVPVPPEPAPVPVKRPPKASAASLKRRRGSTKAEEEEPMPDEPPPAEDPPADETEREQLGRLFRDAQGLGSPIYDGDSGADLTGLPLCGDDFADFVLNSCDDPESRKQLAARLAEAAAFNRMMAEENANPLVKPKRWVKMVVTIAGCDGETDSIDTGGPGKGAGGGGGLGPRPGPIEPGPGRGPDQKAPKIGPRPEPPSKQPIAPEEEKRLREWLAKMFPYMDMENIVITGSRGGQNCLACTMGLKDRLWENNMSPDQLAALSKREGWIDDPHGDVEMAVWTNEFGVQHVSRYLGNGWHESKMGRAGPRVIHTDTDLMGSILYRNVWITEFRRGRVVPPPK